MRRLLIAVCVAGLFAAVVVQSIPVNICAYLTPGSYWSIVFGCDGRAAGGGGSGASLP